jgi:hypothetical protein
VESVDPPIFVLLQGATDLVLGEQGVMNANVSGGSGPFQYFWAFNGSGGAWTTNGNFTFRPLFDGIFEVNLTVQDAQHQNASARQDVHVTGADPVSVTISVGESGAVVVFSAHALGGTGPYRYHWSGPGAPAGWSASAEWADSNLPTGTSQVGVTVRDANNYSATHSLNVVNSAPSATPWFTSLIWPLVGVVVGFAITLTMAFLLVRRRGAGEPKE